MNKTTLRSEFSYMFDSGSEQPVNQYGIETPDGWNTLIFILLSSINYLDKDRYVRIEQIKSKVGELRFYFRWDGPEIKSFYNWYVGIVKRLPWSIRKFLGNPTWQRDLIYNQIFDLVDTFERASTHICEDCGEEATKRIVDGWVYTLCNKCFRVILDEELVKALESTTENERLLISGHFQPEDV